MEKRVLKDLCFLFLKDRLLIEKSSLLTVKSYDSDLRALFYRESPLWIRCFKDVAAAPDISLSALQKRAESSALRSDIEAAVKTLIQKSGRDWIQLSPSSQNRKLSAVKSFIAWLFKNGFTDSDFRSLYSPPKTADTRPDFLSVDEIFFLIRSIENRRDKNKSRDLALFSLLYGAALRVSEAGALKKKDLDLDEGTALVLGKGRKPRLVPLPAGAIRRLKAFYAPGVYFFGKAPLLPRTAHRIVQKWGQSAGLLKPLHPHTLRHSCATHLLSAGADLRSLQELLGHKTLTATQKYTHLDLSALARTLEKSHPLCKKSSPKPE